MAQNCSGRRRREPLRDDDGLEWGEERRRRPRRLPLPVEAELGNEAVIDRGGGVPLLPLPSAMLLLLLLRSLSLSVRCPN